MGGYIIKSYLDYTVTVHEGFHHWQVVIQRSHHEASKKVYYLLYSRRCGG